MSASAIAGLESPIIGGDCGNSVKVCALSMNKNTEKLKVKIRLISIIR
jgi:hypothetical protein